MNSRGAKINANMPRKCPRPYRLGQRATAMEETRVRILATAEEIILSQWAFSEFSMEAVARKAGVTRVTVYHRFGSKRGLLEALFDRIGTRGRLGEMIPAAFSHSDAVEALRAYVLAFCDFWDGDRVLNRRLRGFALLDKDFAEVIASRYARRHRAIEVLLRRLQSHGCCNISVNQADLIQTLLALTSFEFYDELAGQRRPEQIAPIVFRLVSSELGLTPDLPEVTGN